MYYSCQAEQIIVVNNEMSLSEIFHSVVYKNMYWYMSADLKWRPSNRSQSERGQVSSPLGWCQKGYWATQSLVRIHGTTGKLRLVWEMAVKLVQKCH